MQCVRERGTWVWFKHPYDAKLYVSSKANWRDTFTYAVPINPELIRFKIGKFFHHGYSPRYANQLIHSIQMQINRMNNISGYVVSHRLLDPSDPLSMEPCVMFASPAFGHPVQADISGVILVDAFQSSARLKLAKHMEIEHDEQGCCG